MIQITPHMKILLAVEPVDFRKGIDGLAMLCRTVLRSDPFSGCVFVFLNNGHEADLDSRPDLLPTINEKPP